MASQAQVVEGAASAEKMRREAHRLTARAGTVCTGMSVAAVSASEERAALESG